MYSTLPHLWILTYFPVGVIPVYPHRKYGLRRERAGRENREGIYYHSSGKAQWRPELDQKAVELENKGWISLKICEGRIPVGWMWVWRKKENQSDPEFSNFRCWKDDDTMEIGYIKGIKLLKFLNRNMSYKLQRNL